MKSKINVIHYPDSTFSNVFSLETAKPIEAIFHAELPWNEGTKDSSNVPGHMTNMSAISIYGKNLKKIFFTGTKRPMTLNVGMQSGVLKYEGEGG